jgi:hypothetical protein
MTAANTGRILTEVPAVSQAAALPTLRCSPVPVQEPRPASRVALPPAHDAPPPTQGTLALATSVEPAPGMEVSGLDGVTHGRSATSQSGLLPEPKAWAATFIQAAMEVASGVRSPGQLIRWTTPDVHSALVRRGALTARARRNGGLAGAKPRLRALLSGSPRPGICEVAAVISEPERVRAVAFRMEGLHGRWRVTQIEIG